MTNDKLKLKWKGLIHIALKLGITSVKLKPSFLLFQDAFNHVSGHFPTVLQEWFF